MKKAPGRGLAEALPQRAEAYRANQVQGLIRATAAMDFSTTPEGMVT